MRGNKWVRERAFYTSSAPWRLVATANCWTLVEARRARIAKMLTDETRCSSLYEKIIRTDHTSLRNGRQLFARSCHSLGKENGGGGKVSSDVT